MYLTVSAICTCCHRLVAFCLSVVLVVDVFQVDSVTLFNVAVVAVARSGTASLLAEVLLVLHATVLEPGLHLYSEDAYRQYLYWRYK